jgi:arylsulfatase A-like enzyme
VKYRLAAEGLEAALTRPWKLALGGDLRGCLLAVPGRPLEREVVVPAAGSAFRFAYGIPYGVGAPVRFRVGVEARERARVNAFDEVVRPGRPGQVDAWHEGTIDLSPFAGERVRLVLETSSRGSLDPLRGLPAWANPEVWSEASAPLPPNLILISLDTLRADRLSLYGYPRPTSPNIDAWARRRAAVFLDAVAPSPWTLPSHVSLFTGLDALRHGVNQVDPVPRSLKMMAQWLRAAGYATVAVTGGAYLSAGYGFDRGFDSFAAWPAAPGTDPPEVEVGIDRSLRWLRALADRPFFLFFHTYEIHEPYQPRQPFYSQLSPGSPEAPEGRSSPVPPTARDGFAVRRRALLGATPVADADLPVLDRLYDAGVAFTDAQLGRLLRELQALGLEGRTAVVITSDHGEALGERGLGGHAYLYDFNLSIPLIVSLPDGRGRGRRIPNQVRLVDVLPTLLELAGIAPGSGGDGASLLPLIEEPSRAAPRDAWSYASSSNYGIALRTPNRVKYIFNNTAWSPACGREELFDLVTDPREENDAAPGSGLVAELRRRVDRRLQEWSGGISVRFSNRSAGSYAGSLQAPFLHQITVKADGQSCPDVSWNERAGHVDYVVRPGQSFGVVLEDAGSEALKITAAFSAAGSGFERSLDPRDLGRPWQIRSDGGGWRDGPAGAVPPDTGIVVRWLGDPQRREGRARERDAATDEQLRALGYVQ